MLVRDVYNIAREHWGDNKNACQALFDYISRSEQNISEHMEVGIRQRISACVSKVRARWERSRRMAERFLEDNAKWLDGEVEFLKDEAKTDIRSKSGRPLSSFDELNDRNKLRRTETLRSQVSSSELGFAASSSMWKNGDREGCVLLKEIIQNPQSSKQIKSAWEKEKAGDHHIAAYTPDEALSLIVSANLSKNQYLLLRKGAQSKHARFLYPSYEDIKKAKNDCYPCSASITITEDKATMSLQTLLDLTVSRLLIVIEPVLSSLEQNKLQELQFVIKWGSDGSSGHSRFKQVALQNGLDDSSLYMTSIVPLQLFSPEENGRKTILWQNPRPSSPRYCRPLQLEFVKETAAHILETTKSVEGQITELRPTSVTINGKNVTTCHKMYMTMIDGKICNVLTGTKSSQVCNICGAKPSQMNDVDLVTKLTINEDNIKFGLHTLHAWIRSLEYMLHVAYKLPVGKYQCRTQHEKDLIKNTKERIQKEFKEKVGILVDFPKQGFGSSNDGNTARRFFGDPTTTASITGLQKDIIVRLSTVLHALASGYEISVEKFHEYCMTTYRECVKAYPWYVMPPSVHKLLLHGHQIILACPLPIGMLSEESQEARHKDCKRIRAWSTRKHSRTACNEDLLHMLLISSDPVITAMRKVPAKKREPFSAAVLALITEPHIYVGCKPTGDEETSSNESSSEEED